MRKRELMKRIASANVAVAREISANSSGKFGGGLASEGYAGGYRDALGAIVNLLNDAEPNDPRGYWTAQGDGNG